MRMLGQRWRPIGYGALLVLGVTGVPLAANDWDAGPGFPLDAAREGRSARSPSSALAALHDFVLGPRLAREVREGGSLERGLCSSRRPRRLRLHDRRSAARSGSHRDLQTGEIADTLCPQGSIYFSCGGLFDDSSSSLGRARCGRDRCWNRRFVSPRRAGCDPDDDRQGDGVTISVQALDEAREGRQGHLRGDEHRSAACTTSGSRARRRRFSRTGKSATITATLKKGKNAYKCTVPGHAAGGMKGTFSGT